MAFPTETVYGLGASALLPTAVAQVYQVKGRPSDNPLIVHIAEPEQLEPFVDNKHPFADKLMETFWPGLLTLIFSIKKTVYLALLLAAYPQRLFGCQTTPRR